MLREEGLLKRHPANPIIKPADFPGTEAIFNCGQTMYGKKTILLVSIVFRNGAVETRVAESDDGLRFTIADKSLFDFAGTPFEPYANHQIDTRVTRIGDAYYIVFPGGTGPLGPAGILLRTKDFQTCEPMEIISLPPNRVPCLFPEKIGGQYVRIDRPGHTPAGPGEMWISYSPDLIHWGRHRLLTRPFARWQSTKIGPTPPIKTREGWLMLIHGARTTCAGNVYSLGAVLIDLEDPSRIIGRTRSWILTPDEPYELMGRTLNVVFACGCIPDYEQDRLRVYYGGADTCIGLATCKLSDLVALCREEA
ncbi:MAG: glycoside hydrolase family 130 protein [Candidatus Sumerlaeota bacterium]|nr:glycoside hydrolase family 130 protein [Candidatus Sumerlaeota bacterium]